MTLILSIETATKVCSVSLGLNGKLIAVKEEASEKFVHSEKLNLFIEEVIQQTNYTLQNLDAICVSKGPGSYTGLRIGVSCAKGLCYALDIPLISIDSLSVLANGYKESNNVQPGTLLMPMIDARRMEVYIAPFNSQGIIQEPISAKIIDANSFELSNKVILFGDGADKCRAVITNPNVFIDNYLSTSKDMVTLSYTKFLENNFEDVAYFEPFYLKDFIAG